MSEELQPQGEPLALETAFTLLSHSTRRGLLECLTEYDETLALADVSEEVAAALEDKRVRDIHAEVVKQVYMALYHSHIPKLGDHGIVTYDQEHDLVALTERGHQLAESLDRFRESYPHRVEKMQ